MEKSIQRTCSGHVGECSKEVNDVILEVTHNPITLKFIKKWKILFIRTTIKNDIC